MDTMCKPFYFFIHYMQAFASQMYRFSAALLIRSNLATLDTAVVTITFQNGCLGVIDNSRRATYGYDQRVEVFGSKGALSCINDTPTSVTLANESGVGGGTSPCTSFSSATSRRSWTK